MNRNLKRQLIASKDGAALMAALFTIVLILATWFDWNVYEWPAWLKTIILPATLFNGLPGTDLWLGVPLLTIILSGLI